MAILTELPKFERPAEGDLEAMRARIRHLQETDAPRFDGTEPVDAVALYQELLTDYDNAFPKYYEKRIRLTGIVSKIEPDEFGAPSFQFTDEQGSRCYGLIVFPNEDIYTQVKEGERVEIIGNIIFIREPYGLVVKKCELWNEG